MPSKLVRPRKSPPMLSGDWRRPHSRASGRGHGPDSREEQSRKHQLASPPPGSAPPTHTAGGAGGSHRGATGQRPSFFDGWWGAPMPVAAPRASRSSAFQAQACCHAGLLGGRNRQYSKLRRTKPRFIQTLPLSRSPKTARYGTRPMPRRAGAAARDRGRAPQRMPPEDALAVAQQQSVQRLQKDRNIQ